jgi:tryptophanyl-tRNA synthetase
LTPHVRSRDECGTNGSSATGEYDIAQRFNARYGQVFVAPEHRIPEVAGRVMDLQVPNKKMSTTGGTELGTVLVLDEPDEIRRKVKAAVTDSGQRHRQG